MRLADFPPFDGNPKCTKCGFSMVATRYVPNSAACPAVKCPNQGGLPEDLKAEHLHRTCERCGYWWSERVLELESDSVDDDAAMGFDRGCPFCHAATGEPCHTADGRPCSDHAARRPL